MTTSDTAAPWPQRAAVLAGLGLLLGWLVADLSAGEKSAAITAIIGGLCVFGVAFGLLWDRGRLVLAAGLALAAALVVAAACWWSGLGAPLPGPDLLRLPSAVIAIAVAVPLFQASRSASARAGSMGRLPAISYAEAHDRAWVNLVTVAAALGFTLVSWLLAWMLASLFRLIGFEVLERLLGQSRIALALAGAAFGAGGGLARDSSVILSTLQRVLRFVLSALTPVLALGLAMFLLALAFTGLEPLWQATRSTTPILMSSIAAGLVLANTVIADGADDEGRHRLLRASATLLLAMMLPMALLAAVSLGQRVGQYGWTPDRLWAAAVVTVALAYGASGLWALLRPSDWMARARRGNLVMAFLLCGLALLLATPLLDFGGISTRSQVARLDHGRVRPETFDWAALRCDFGPSGEAAVRRLANAGGKTGQSAKAALQARKRWELEEAAAPAPSVKEILVIPQGPAGAVRDVPPGIATLLQPFNVCEPGWQLCVLHLPPGADRATLFGDIDPLQNTAVVMRFRRIGNSWTTSTRTEDTAGDTTDSRRDQIAKLRAAIKAGRATVRPAMAEQLLIDNKPVAIAPPEP
jgi:hypothetical protein